MGPWTRDSAAPMSIQDAFARMSCAWCCYLPLVVLMVAYGLLVQIEQLHVVRLADTTLSQPRRGLILQSVAIDAPLIPDLKELRVRTVLFRSTICMDCLSRPECNA